MNIQSLEPPQSDFSDTVDYYNARTEGLGFQFSGMALHAPIAGAKGAVEGLTRSLAAEFAPQIRVIAIAPSLVDTPLAENLLSTEEKRHGAAERHPLKRIGRLQDIARMAVFLLSDAADWVTGQVLHIDGGMSTLRIFK